MVRGGCQPRLGRGWLSLVAVLGAVGALVLAVAPGSARAASATFTCSASALRVTALGVANVEPEVANAANDPCAGASAQTAGVSVPGVLSTGVASATTASTATRGSATGTVNGTDVAALGISATMARSTAADTCVAGAPALTHSSTVAGLTVGGTPVTVSGQQVSLGSLGVATVNLDETIATATGVTQRAADITVAGGVDNGAHIVLGEASAGAVGNPCASGAGAGGGGGGGGGTGTGSGGTGAPVNAGGNGGSATAGAPSISGTPGVGDTLTANPGTFTGAEPIGYSYQWYRDGEPISQATRKTYKATKLDAGHHLSVKVTARNAAGAQTVTSRSVYVPYPAGCPAATGKVTRSGIGPARLGQTPKQARAGFKKSHRHGYRYEDFFCFTPVGVRVGYASPKELRGASKATRRALADKVIWVSSSSTHYVVDGVRSGAKLAVAKRKLHLGKGYRVGRNVWYFGHVGNRRLLVKAPHKTAEEIGIANASLTRTWAQQRKFLRSFT